MKLIFLIFFFVCATVYSQSVVKMERQGDIYLIPCRVNDLKLKFIFDTGASDVSISLTEAIFMIKNGYLDKSDIRGKEYYQNANGEIHEGTKLNLKIIEIGNEKLFNVEASVVNTTTAPLLLGQSVLKRLGKYTIDYSSNTLTFGKTAYNTNVKTNTSTIDLNKSNQVPNDVLQNEIRIGAQIWMNSNLDISRYMNGDLIPQVQSQSEWINLKTGAWCYYENSTESGITYGKLYNWYAVNDSRGLAPVGWHIPSDDEWNILIKFLGGFSVAGDKLKATYGWDFFKKDSATNSTHFSALPGGYRDGGFGSQLDGGFFWSSSEFSPSSAGCFHLSVNRPQISYELQENGKRRGYSVRCIKN